MLAIPMRRFMQAGLLAVLWQIPALAEQARPWLGVTLEPVPPALVRQLNIEQGGLMISNIVSDSPADKAGLERFDVLLEADGRPIPDNPAEFIRVVRGKQPGDALKLALLHAGERRTVEVPLASEPLNPHDLPWKHPDVQGWPYPSPDVRGKILRRGPRGWVWDDLGPLPPMHMEDRLRSYVDNLLPGEHEVTVLRRVDKDGGVLQIRVDRDGGIEVKRYNDRNGEQQTEIRSFANVDELRERDPDAFAFYQSLREDQRPDAPPPPPSAVNPPDWRKRADELRGRAREWRDYLDRYRDDLKRWEQESQRHLNDKDWQEWSQRFFQGPLRPLKPEPLVVEPTTRPATPEAEFRFEVRPDGGINAHLRDQDAELTRSFASEAEMKAAAPDLYNRFKALNDRLLR